MSFRSYITINGSDEKVYESYEQCGEYLCDVCGKVMERGSPQIHLMVDGTMFHTIFESEDSVRIEKFPLDVHANNECIKGCGLNILRSLPGWNEELKTLFRGPYGSKVKVSPGGKRIYHPDRSDSSGRTPDLNRPTLAVDEYRKRLAEEIQALRNKS